MTTAPDRAYVRNALEAAENAALSITRVELCHVLLEVQRTLGAEGPVGFVRSLFGLEDSILPDLTADQTAGASTQHFMPLATAIGDS